MYQRSFNFCGAKVLLFSDLTKFFFTFLALSPQNCCYIPQNRSPTSSFSRASTFISLSTRPWPNRPPTLVSRFYSFGLSSPPLYTTWHLRLYDLPLSFIRPTSKCQTLRKCRSTLFLVQPLLDKPNPWPHLHLSLSAYRPRLKGYRPRA